MSVYRTIGHLVIAVDVRLHEPLLSRGITLSDVRVEMMSLCSQLELLCRKELYEVLVHISRVMRKPVFWVSYDFHLN